MINPNDPAFPTLHYNETTGNANGHSPGLSIRAKLATETMKAILSNSKILIGIIRDIPRKQRTDENCRAFIAKESIAMADALIAELNKTSS